MDKDVIRGFTLVELMVVVALAAITMSLAVPSIKKITQLNRVSGATNSFVGDLRFARAEAVKRGASVSVCPSSNGSTCLATNTWQSGWIVFYDANGNGLLESGDTLLRSRTALTGGDTLVAAPSRLAITYNREGFASNLTSGTVTLALRTADSNANATRCVAVNIVGRLTVQTVGNGSCS